MCVGIHTYKVLSNKAKFYTDFFCSLTIFNPLLSLLFYFKFRTFREQPDIV